MLNKVKTIWTLYSQNYRECKLNVFDGVYVLITNQRKKIFNSEYSLLAYMERVL